MGRVRDYRIMCPGGKGDKSVKLTRHILKYCSSVTSVKQFGYTSEISKLSAERGLMSSLKLRLVLVYVGTRIKRG